MVRISSDWNSTKLNEGYVSFILLGTIRSFRIAENEKITYLKGG